jgi:hypothetical protein
LMFRLMVMDAHVGFELDVQVDGDWLFRSLDLDRGAAPGLERAGEQKAGQDSPHTLGTRCRG